MLALSGQWCSYRTLRIMLTKPFFNLMCQSVLEVGYHRIAPQLKNSTNLRPATLSFRMHLHHFKAQSNGNSAKTCEMSIASIFEHDDLHFMFCRTGPSIILESNISSHQHLYVSRTLSFGTKHSFG